MEDKKILSELRYANGKGTETSVQTVTGAEMRTIAVTVIRKGNLPTI